MVFQNKVIACIKVNGQILREHENKVALPFGCEYSILIKNLNSARIRTGVSVDGTDAGEGTFIIGPNSSLELERFIVNGNLEAGNRFKFIKRTAEIERHRGIQVDDGIIRIESWLERVPEFVDIPIPRYYPVPRPRPYPWPRPPRWGQSNLRRPIEGRSRRMPMRAPMRPLNARASGASRRPDRSDMGITVPGSESRQRFSIVGDFPVYPESTVIVLCLRGSIGSKPVLAPVTVKAKPSCETCGRANKPNAQFCINCGTAMQLI